MKVMSFTYTKDNSSTSHRDLLVLTEPSTNVFGIDITCLDAEEQGQFVAQMEIIEQQRKHQVDTLMLAFDIAHRYRSFKPANISDVLID